MFENIGKKIKNLVEICFAIGVIISICFAVGNFIMASEADELLMMGYVYTGLIYLIVVPLLLWIGMFVLYAFGELVEDTHKIRLKLYNESEKNEETKKKAKPIKLLDYEEDESVLPEEEEQKVCMVTDDGRWICPVCAREIDNSQHKCKCGYILENN